MNLTLAVTGAFGHAEAEFVGDRIVITYKATTPGERGTISTLVEKAQKKGMTLHTGKNGEVKKALGNIVDVLLDKKGQVILTGEKAVVEQLALETVEEEVKSKRVVSEAQEDGTWKVVKIGEFKAKEGEKKQAVTSHAPAVGG
jgi:sorbitol-specific phosphotransferase system component IIA